MMGKNKGPFYLILNGKASEEIAWHCKHYVLRNLMVKYDTGADLAKGINVCPKHLAKTFALYTQNGKDGKDAYGKKFFHNSEFSLNDFFNVAQVCPVVHYTMGGV
mmetsp:Transcript_6711/g.915  ORF Transcript_6711/g.915 Transcript_6711/m.915 type:complete len:105 (+) Transcript_6711:341-655(+)